MEKSSAKPKLYVACSLTQAPQSFRNHIADLREALKEHFTVVELVSNPRDMESNRQDLEYCQHIFTHDRDCVLSADFILADVTYPAIGLGYEIALAVENNKPLLAVAQKNASVSRLIKGITHPKFAFQTYSNPTEILSLTQQYFASFSL